jgi:hypothetical protein
MMPEQQEKISMVRSLLVGVLSFAGTAAILVGSLQGSAVIG